MNRHWTEDDFIAKVYGLGPEDGHLEGCAACRASWVRFEARRAFVVASVGHDLPPAVLEELRTLGASLGVGVLQ